MDSSRGGTYLSVSPMAARWWGEVVAARQQGWTRPSRPEGVHVRALAALLVGREPPEELARLRVAEARLRAGRALAPDEAAHLERLRARYRREAEKLRCREEC